MPECRVFLAISLLASMPLSVGAVTIVEADAYLDVVRGELVRPAVIVIEGERELEDVKFVMKGGEIVVAN